MDRKLIIGDLGDWAVLQDVFAMYKVDAVRPNYL